VVTASSNSTDFVQRDENFPANLYIRAGCFKTFSYPCLGNKIPDDSVFD
jgi:hypothetical protein